MDRERLNDFAQPIVDMYNLLELDMLENIASLLRGKKDLLEEDPEAWQLQMMQNLGMLDKKNLKIIREKAELKSNELNKLLYGAGLEGLQEGEEALKAAVKKGAHLKVPQPIAENDTILDIIAAYRNQAQDILNLTNTTMLDQSNQIYKDILNRTALDAMSGNLTGEQALRKAIRQWANKGIPALIDKAGRQWSVEGYTRMVMVSTVNNTVNEMQDERFDEWGIDYTEVTSHIGARPKCAPFQGRVFALRPDKATSEYPWIGNTSKGLPDGLFGINCGHNKFPFIPGITEQTYKPYPEDKNKKQYEESQKQRLLERNVRKAKTQEMMFKAAGDEEAAKKAGQLVKARQKQMRKFIDDTGRTRRYAREGVVDTSKPEPIPDPPKHVPDIPKKPKKKKEPEKPNEEPKSNVIEEGDKIKYKDNNDMEQTGEVKAVSDGLYTVKDKYGEKVYVTDDEVIGITEKAKKTEKPKEEKPKDDEQNFKNLQAGDAIFFDFNGNKEPGKILYVDEDGYYRIDSPKGQKTIHPNKVIQLLGGPSKKKLEKEKPKIKPKQKLDDKKELAKKATKLFKEVYPNSSMDAEKMFSSKSKVGLQIDIEKLEEKKLNLPKDEDMPKIPKKPSKKRDTKKIDFNEKDYSWINPQTGTPDLKDDGEFLRELQDKQRSNVRRYTSMKYESINEYLRFGYGDEEETVNWIDSAFRKHRKGDGLSQNTIVRRNAEGDLIKKLFGEESHKIAENIYRAAGKRSDAKWNRDSEGMEAYTEKINDELEKLNKRLAYTTTTDKAFVSSTYDKNEMGTFTKHGGMQFDMYLPKGFKDGIFVQSISEFSEEKEFLLNRGIEFEIFDVEFREVVGGRENIVFKVRPVIK